MTLFPLFLSVVVAVRNQDSQLKEILEKISTQLSSCVDDYELIVVDNASDDESVQTLKKLTDVGGLPNLQVYALTKEVSSDTAAWVGLENALGDFVAVIDPVMDDIGFIPKMLEKAVNGSDVVFAVNDQQPRQSVTYHIAYNLYNIVYKKLNGIHLSMEAPSYRLISKRVINFILQHPQPSIMYRHLPATGGFAREYMQYSFPPMADYTKNFRESIDRGRQLLVSTSQAPMRLVTGLSLFGAAANLFYSIYVLAIGLFKSDVAPGWISLSLQQSGMFFLVSLVLLVLGEYILQMANVSNNGPLYHVAQEFTSSRITRKEKLNIESAIAKTQGVPGISKNLLHENE